MRVRTAVASELAGHAIEHIQVGDGEWGARMKALGLPEQYVEFLLGIFRASRAGEFAVVDPTLWDLLGHKPTLFRDVLATRLQH